MATQKTSSFKQFFKDFFPWKKSTDDLINFLVIKGIFFIALLVTTIIATVKFNDLSWQKILLMGWWLIPFSLTLIQGLLNMTTRAHRKSGYYEVNVSSGTVTRKTNPLITLILLMFFFFAAGLCVLLPHIITPAYLVFLGLQILLHIAALVKNKVVKKNENEGA